MIRDVAVELRRLTWRRAVGLLLLAAVVVLLVLLGYTVWKAIPPATQERGWLAREWKPPVYPELFGRLVPFASYLGMLAMALAGITFAGADWAAGTMATPLLVQPRRERVFTSKTFALVALSVPFGALLVGLAWGGALWVSSKWGTTDLAGVTPGQLTWRAVAGVAMVALGGVLGLCAAMIVRGSLGGAGVLAGYGFVVEFALAMVIPSLRPALPSSQARALLQGSVQVTNGSRNCGLMSDGLCERSYTLVTAGQGALYLSVLLVAVVAVAVLTFRQRDVP